MNPKVTVKSRSALTKRIIPLLHRNLKEAADALMKKELENVPGVGFTSDIWSSRGLHSYLALTMHFIDRQWRLHRLVMDCKNFDERHTGTIMGEKIDRMIETIGLPPSASIAMVTDAGSNMVKAMRESPNVADHLICVCHILSNCLKDAFESPLIEAAIDKLRDLASATHKSLQRTLEIKKECLELNGKNS